MNTKVPKVIPKKVTLKWSKKENDWEIKYPTRNGKIVGNGFFSMISEFEKFMRTNWKNEPTGFTNLRDHLSQGGFDPDTFTISVKMKIDDTSAS